MPELPEVEVLVRHLAPRIKGKTIRAVEVRRARTIAPSSERQMRKALLGTTFNTLTRRGKYLLFNLRKAGTAEPIKLIGHLGMTGRIYLVPKDAQLPKHAPVVFELEDCRMIFEDTRYFGKMTLDPAPLDKLGPEPMGTEFTADYLALAVRDSRQPIKVRLMDQALVAGIGNIYASEALFQAGISPRIPANKLTRIQISRLRQAIQKVLAKAIKLGSSSDLDFAGAGERDGLFYYGGKGDSVNPKAERFLVYDRHGEPCRKCGTPIERIVQAARSTYYCPECQSEGG